MSRCRPVIVALVTLGLPWLCHADFDLTFLDKTDTLTWTFDGAPPFPCVAETCVASDTFVGYVSPGINLLFNILDPDGLTLSDTLQITSVTGSDLFVSTFNSDIEGGTLLPLPGGTPVNEDGTVQTAATIALNGGFAGQNLIVHFQSDIDAVPEPASVLLLGTLLVGLAATVRRKQSLR